MTAPASTGTQPAEYAAELRSALEMLEAVVAIRIEERRGSPSSRLLGLDGPDEGIPPLSRYRGRAPLARVVADAGLTAPEALVLVAAIAPHVDEKFDRLYAELTDRPGAVGLTGEVARTLAARTFGGRLEAAVQLSSGAPLLASGLLSLDPAGDLSGRLRADPALVRWVLGLPPEPVTVSTDFPARPLTTVHSLDDVVLPGPARRRITDLANRISHRDLVVETWGFGRHHDNTAGLLALFHGPPGTGKTMTAAALSRSTGLTAYLVDLSALVSKYIGETEKALARVFDRAVRERCLLVFDEADAVFGRRTEVSDSHDRYANQEVSYLLSRIEAHPGVVILTTNLLANIDEAFQRRIHVMVEFPEPGPAERVRLWRAVLPPELPVADEVDLDALAQRYPLSGAQIRDASLDAAYLAAADAWVVTQDYLVSGIHRQFEKAGRTVR
ncbi:ATP-binding protein [Geodermatophilus sp. CPCC 205761]|uniref:ATP-binding protein n=1 Tax=Geodermatophilus sp. CPCC 205761 TaxID=2936597 RepID=UPI003EE9CB6F